MPAGTQRLPPNVFSNRNPVAHPATEHSTVILLDHVNGDIENATIERQGVLDLLKKVRPDERIALYVIGKMEGLILLQDYTSNRDLLAEKVCGNTSRKISRILQSFHRLPVRRRPSSPLQTDDTAEDVRLALQALALSISRWYLDARTFTGCRADSPHASCMAPPGSPRI